MNGTRRNQRLCGTNFNKHGKNIKGGERMKKTKIAKWMKEEMLTAVRQLGHKPAHISFGAGYDKSSDGTGRPVRTPFFEVYFKDGKEYFRGFWDPETQEIKVEFMGR